MSAKAAAGLRKEGGIKAVLWDVGGVLTESPLASFAKLEKAQGLPAGFLVKVNSQNYANNAWARMERGEDDWSAFDAAFRKESQALGHEVSGLAVVAAVAGSRVLPEMVAALALCREAGLRLACVTNDFPPGAPAARSAEDEALLNKARGMFDVMYASSKEGARKPEPQVYETVCARLGVAPADAVFIDDLGVNLKPARAMGMTTIKATGTASTLAALVGLVPGLGGLGGLGALVPSPPSSPPGQLVAH